MRLTTGEYTGSVVKRTRRWMQPVKPSKLMSRQPGVGNSVLLVGYKVKPVCLTLKQTGFVVLPGSGGYSTTSRRVAVVPSAVRCSR